jgi:hypothetical protein
MVPREADVQTKSRRTVTIGSVRSDGGNGRSLQLFTFRTKPVSSEETLYEPLRRKLASFRTKTSSEEKPLA